MRSPRRSVRPAARIVVASLLAALAVGGARASVVISFPLTADFEVGSGYAAGPLPGDSIWTVPAGLGAEVTPPGFEGEQALSFLGDAWLSLSPDPLSVAAGYPITWVDFYVRPAYAPLSELSSWANPSLAAATGFVRSDSSGEIYAMDGAGNGSGAWLATGKTAALADERPVSWQRISYRIDYERQRWDLYVNGDLTLVDLGFLNQAASSFTYFGLKGSATKASFLDYFYAGDINPLYADANNDGLPDAWLASHGLSGADAGRYADPDRDGLDNITEFRLGLAPVNSDTDGDGVYDGRELARGANPLSADIRALSAFPFADSFEADARGAFVNGTRQWSVGLGEIPSSASVAAAPATGADGQNILVLAGRDPVLEREFAPVPDAEVVWLDFRADLAPRVQPAPASPKDVGAIFYLSTTGDLVALDGSGANGGTWLAVAQLQPPAFHRYTVRLDYAAQRWSLWLDGVLVRANLGFANRVPYFSGFKFEHEAVQTNKTAGLDAVSATTVEPPALDNDNDGLSNDQERAFGSNLDLADSDGDGIWDKTEHALGTDPLQANGLAAQLVQDASGACTWRAYFSTAEGYAAGYLAGQQGWVAAGESRVVDETARLVAITAAASIEHYFATSQIDRVWIRFRAKLEPGELPSSADVAGPVSGMFGYRHPNTLAVFDAVTSTWIEHAVPSAADDWNDYVLFFDYSAKRWMLALNGRLVARDLPFRDNGLNHLARLRVLQEGSETATEPKQAEIDDIVVSNVSFAGLDLDGDGLLDNEERSLGTDPYLADTDSDGLPDKWEIDNGINPLLADATADKDQDGFSNLVEFQQGTDPSAATTVLAGKAHWDEWKPLVGSAVKDLTASGAFPNQPAMRSLLGSLELPASRGIEYGSRLRAWLLPPVTGDYTFWVAGDEDAELWLSRDENPFDRQRIARSGGWTSAREWEKRPDLQRSAPVALVAGQRYYVEVLHKQNGGADHLAVAWQIPGEARAVIGSAYLEAFPRFADDQDEDGLSDAWEVLNGLNTSSGSGSQGAYGDLDADSLSNFVEFGLGTKANAIDSDGDQVSDYAEVEFGTNPLDSDANALVGAPPPWLLGSIGGKSFQWVAQADGKVALWTNAAAFAAKADVGGILYQSIAGNFSTEGSVIFPDPSRTDVEGGIMVRASLAGDAAFLSITRKLNTGWIVRYRGQNGAKVLTANLGAGTPLNYTKFGVQRIGSMISLFGQTVSGVRRKLADYPLHLGTGSAIVGYVAWTEAASKPGAMTFVVGDVGQPAAGGLSPDLSSFDSSQWLGEWDGFSSENMLAEMNTGSAATVHALQAAGAEVALVGYQPGASAARKGAWAITGADIYALDRRGELEWTIQVPEAGMLAAELKILEGRMTKTAPSYFPLKLFVDGQYIGTKTLSVAAGEDACGLWFTPWLGAGAHSIRVIWDGYADYTSLKVRELRLHKIGGADLDENGRPDWVDRRLALFNGMDVVGNEISTPFSPLPIEGRSRWPLLTSLEMNGTALSVHAGAGYRWYGEVPLSRGQASQLTYRSENGALARSFTANWTAHDPMSGGSFKVRAGSTLLVAGNHEGNPLSITINGSPVAMTDGFGEVTFDQAGIYTLVADLQPASGYPVTTEIRVYAPPALPAFNGLVLRERIVTKPSVDSAVVLQADPRLQMVQVPTNAAQLAWQADDNVGRRVIARAGADGPVLSGVDALCTEVYATLETYTKTLRTLSDGSTETETLVIMSPIRSNHAIRLEIFVAGVVFDDGSIVKVLGPADLDELGQAKVRIIRPPAATTSVCHRTQLVHAGTVIGTK